jgi:hypothetical protein
MKLTWVQIVEEYLEKNGFDGLKRPGVDCHCKLGNLFDCAFDTFTFECKAEKCKEAKLL